MTRDPFDRSHGEVRRLSERRRVPIAALALALLMGGILLAVPSPFRESVSDAPVEADGALVEASSPRVFRSSTAAGGVSLGMEESARAHGFLHAPDLAPGDVVVGELRLDVSPRVDPAAFSLSLWIDGALEAPEGQPRLVDSLHVTSLKYAGAQLIRGSARDLVREIDGDAARGNRDGALSLAELAPGVAGLAPPAAASDGGSILEIAVRFDPAVTGDGTQFAGQRLNLTFGFGLADLRAAPAPPSAPSAPIALQVTSVGPGAVSLSWSPPASTGGLPLTGYRVYRGQSPLSEVAFVQAASYSGGGLAAGTYHFAVAASSAAGTGPLSNVVEVIVPVAPTSSVVITPAAPEGADGWYLTPPHLAFSAQPAGAVVLAGLDGATPVATTDLTLPPGAHTVTYFARAGGLDETPRTLALKHDADSPALSDVRLAGVPLEEGGVVTVSALAQDADAGIASVTAIIMPSVGVTQERALTFAGGRYQSTFTPEGAGQHALALVARDHAGRETRVDLGALETAAPTVEPEDDPTPTTPTITDGGTTGGSGPIGGPGGGSTGAAPTPGSGAPLERTGTDGGSTPGATTDSSGAAVLVLRPDNSTVDPRNGLDGVVTVRLENGKDLSRTLIYVVSPNGTVTLLGAGGEARWDTSSWPDGFYTIETRERHEDGTETTVASTTVLVRHPKSTAVAAGVAVATGVGIAVGTGSGFGAAGSALASRFASLWTIAEKYLAGIGEDKFRERTKRFAIFAGRGGSRMNPWLAAFIASTILAAFFTLGAIAGWSFWDFANELPVVGGATIAFYATAYIGETLLTRHTGAKAEFRLLVSGMLALAVSTILLRNPFGYAGYVEKDEVGDDAALPQRRFAALRVFANFGIMLATILPFLLVGFLWRYDIADWGIFIAMTALATSSMPLKPLNGSELWAWSKPVAVVCTVAAFVLYFLYVLALLPMMLLAALSALGLVTFALLAWRLRKASQDLVDTGVDHAGPTR